ncbi:MAG TPA: ATP-binding protein [Planctomycetota bacterium]
MSRRWFLQRRITLAFALTTLLLSAALSVPFGAAVHGTLRSEITSLAREELDEARAYFLDRHPSPDEFAGVAASMQSEHPENPLAWRILDAQGAVWGEFGRTELLRHVPPSPPGGKVVIELGRSLRVVSGRLDGGMRAVVVLDARHQEGAFRRFTWSVVGFVLLATACATLAGHLLGRHASRLLAQVAESARASVGGEAVAEPPAAPEEIRAVVQALQGTLRSIREEGEGTRLLVSGLAHELRSPLQNLMGETQVALLREREPGEYRRVLESHLEELGELSRVVDNLVTLASIEEARQHAVERFDLAAEGRLRLAREQALAQRRGVELRLALEGPAWIDGDRESLLLALRNVVSNAIEWSPPGRPVEVALRANDGEVEVVVDDAGPGVAPADRERIFRPFQSGKPANGQRAGFGLGLALTHSAVRSQGGRIAVESSPAGGARFRLHLPVQRGRSAGAGPA